MEKLQKTVDRFISICAWGDYEVAIQGTFDMQPEKEEEEKKVYDEISVKKRDFSKKKEGL